MTKSQSENDRKMTKSQSENTVKFIKIDKINLIWTSYAF